MDDIVYQQLRNEMTAIFTIFRQLQIAQYAVIAALAAATLSARRIWASLGSGFALAGIILVVTYVGPSWYLHGMRIGTYLLVAWEVPELKRHIGDADFDRKRLWILANRSESLRGESLKYFGVEHKGKYPVGTPLRDFYKHQLLLLLFPVAVIVGAIILYWKQVSGQKKKVWSLVAFTAVPVLITICICTSGIKQTDERLRSQIRGWADYIKDRPQADRRYLEEMELE